MNRFRSIDRKAFYLLSPSPNEWSLMEKKDLLEITGQRARQFFQSCLDVFAKQRKPVFFA
jgi:hypothetical protein